MFLGNDVYSVSRMENLVDNIYAVTLLIIFSHATVLFGVLFQQSVLLMNSICSNAVKAHVSTEGCDGNMLSKSDLKCSPFALFLSS